MLKGSPVDIIVGGIAIGDTVQKDCICRESPVSWRRMIFMVRPYSPVINRAVSVFVLVQVILSESLAVGPGEGKDAQKRKYEEC